MNTEQLNSARLARWSQNGEARLTLDAAAEWLNAIGFCPYLPATQTASAPAPSFLEAVVGRPAQMPSAGERSRASELLARMVEDSAVVPLKLGNSLGEQPDVVASPEVLRYIYSLRGNRNFKVGPSTVGNEKVTPLALHCWQAIQEQGPLDVPTLQPILGRDITEAAIARALQELWVGMYVIPILSMAGKPAQWELLSRRFPQQVGAGASTGQAESQSAMVSLYLHAVVAAAEEEVLAFLSPLAPQSKLREVIRGLGSMRQLDMIDIAGRAHVCLQGGLLPEMVAQLSEEQLGVAMKKVENEIGESGNRETESITSGIGEDRIEIEREPQRAYGDSGVTKKFVPKKFVPKKFIPRESGAGESVGKRFGARPTDRRPGAGRFNNSRSEGTTPSRPRSFAASAGSASASKGRDFKRAGFDRPGSDRPGFGPRNPATRGLGERAKRWEKSAEGPAGRATDGGRPFERKPFKASGFKQGGFKPAATGAAKPWASKGPRSEGEGAKPWVKRTSFGADGSSAPRGGGSAAPRHAKPYAAKSSGFRPAASKAGGFKAGGFKSAKPWARREDAGAEKPWVSKGAESRIGSKKSYTERASRDGESTGAQGPRRGFNKGEGAKPWTKRVSAGGSEDRPKRAEKSYSEVGKSGRNEGPKQGARPAGKQGAKQGTKPFWAKNPRGGKGSVAASRTNRPRGGKKGGKKK